MTLTHQTSAEPKVSEREYELWSIVDTETDGYCFTSEDRAAAERVIGQRPYVGDLRYVLTCRKVRSRCETWFGPDETVPWHTTCAWVGSTEDAREDFRCQRHGWHRQDDPVPAEFIHGSAVA